VLLATLIHVVFKVLWEIRILYYLISWFCRNFGMNYESHNFFNAAISVAFESIPARRRKNVIFFKRLD
jgi:hypothetical protein